MIAFLFPGQGSQQPGMGRDLAEAFAPARLLFEEVDDALSTHLSRLMFEGPESELMLTENAQPALLAARCYHRQEPLCKPTPGLTVRAK